MSLQPPHARSPSLLATAASIPFILESRSEPVLRSDQRPAVPKAAKRSRIWDLADTFHCSIVGTCLSNADLRHVLVRLGVAGADAADDHELHVLGVSLAGRPDVGAKLLQKALDRRHGLSIKQYARAKTEEALRELWNESVQSGDIPGAYWALLSHPAATEAVVKKAFRDVHMLSHLVGAANRADIRRLRQLEEENGRLTEKLERQQRQLRDGFKSRDETISRLNAMLARHIERPFGGASLDAGGETEALRNVLADVNRKLAQETARRERLEHRLSATSAALQKTEAALRRMQGERDDFARDLALVEKNLIGLLHPATGGNQAPFDLGGQAILYVGGRANQIPQLRMLAERAGARFLHHDGGVEHSATLLPGLVGRADHVLFPVDCISHDAVVTIKRLCRQLAKPYRPLRTASLATLVSALATLADADDHALAAS